MAVALYKKIDGKIETQVFKDGEDVEAVKDGWADSPDAAELAAKPKRGRKPKAKVEKNELD